MARAREPARSLRRRAHLQFRPGVQPDGGVDGALAGQARDPRELSGWLRRPGDASEAGQGARRPTVPQVPAALPDVLARRCVREQVAGTGEGVRR